MLDKRLLRMFQSFNITDNGLDEKKSESDGEEEEFLPCEDDILSVVHSEMWFQVRTKYHPEHVEVL